MDTKDIRLALCGPGELYGGVEQFMFTFANHLKSKTDLSLSVVLFHHGDLRERLVQCGIDVTAMTSQAKYNPATIGRVVRLFRDKGINVVHTHGYKANIICAAAGKYVGARIVKTEHGLIEPSPGQGGSNIRMRINLSLDRLATRLLVDQAVYVSRDLASKAPSANGLTVIYNGIPVPDASIKGRSLGGGDPDQFHIGIVGRLSEVKGHRILLDALSKLDDLTGVRLSVFGDGPLLGELERSCARQGLTETVQFMGFTKNMSERMRELDALIMPSLHEGLPYTLLEAMQLDVPVIASGVGGLKEVLVDGEDAVLTLVGDAGYLAEAIEALRRNPEKRKRLSRAAHEKVSRDFSIDKMAERYIEVYMGRETLDNQARVKCR